MPRRLLVLVWVWFAVSIAARAAAEGETDSRRAARLFEEARVLLEQEEFEAACLKLQQSQQLDPQLGTQLHLAHCYEKRGQLLPAYRAFQAAAELAAQRNEHGSQEPREKLARERVESLAAQLPMLELRVSDASDPTLVITLDSEPIDRKQWNRPLAIEAGEHVLHAEAPERQAWDQTFQIAAPARLAIGVPKLALRASASVNLQLPLTAAETRDPAPLTAAEPSLHRISGYIAIGVGVVGLGMGSALGLLSRSTLGKLEQDCDLNAGHCTIARGDLAARERIRRLNDDAATYATGANVGLILGGISALGGIVLVWTAPSGGPRPDVAIGVAPGGLSFTLHTDKF
jgi:tetratricopeptide (TPR) repeat protein